MIGFLSRAPSLETICEFSRPFFPGCQFVMLPAMKFTDFHKNEKIGQRINRHTRQLQYSAEDIIESLKRIRRRERKNDQQELFCIAVTMVDIYPEPGWNFVFGLAAEDDGIGVYSFARMDPLFPIEITPPECTEEEQLLVLKRGIGVFIHEIIHLFGFEHCIYYLCMMNGGESLEEIDGQPLYLCPICLRKMFSVFQGRNGVVRKSFESLGDDSLTFRNQ
jgi:archaemetzincin